MSKDLPKTVEVKYLLPRYGRRRCGRHAHRYSDALRGGLGADILAGGGLAAGQALAANQFQASDAGTAANMGVHFIYDTDDGVLRYDANGSAAGGLLTIATLTSAANLTASDFVFV